MDSLLQERLDLAYMVGKASDPRLDARLVCRERTFVVANNRCPLAANGSLTPGDLAGYTLLVPSDFKSGRVEDDARASMGLGDVEMNVVFFDGAFSHIVERVRMNEGVWVAGESYCRTVDSYGLVFVPLAGVTTDHYLAYRKGAEANPAVRCVLDAFAPLGRTL